jgi:hypothetical protein
VLLIGLGFTLGNAHLIKKSSLKIAKSIGVIFAIGLLASLVFGIPADKEFFSSALFTDTTKSAFLYFLVAFASGVAATYAWIRKKVDNMLPGISIAVSLVPPICMVGIFLGRNPELMRFFFMVFLFNMVGIIGGSMILFSLFKFYNSSKVVQQNIEAQEREEEEERDRREKEEIEKTMETITINNDEKTSDDI